MKFVVIISALVLGSLTVSAHRAHVVNHDKVKKFVNNGNALQGLAVPSTGSSEIEVWQSSVAVGSKTPRHKHDSEEVFVLLEGEVAVDVGGKKYFAKAPATIIAPKGVEHQLENIGKVPTKQIVIIGAGSKIWSSNGKLLNLPWRK